MFVLIAQSVPPDFDRHPDWMEDVEDPDFGDTPGLVNDQNLNDYLVDEIEKEQAEQFNPEQGLPTDYQAIPDSMGFKPVPYPAPQQLVDDGMENMELIGFHYTTKDGIDAGWRVVEPHYTFIPRTTMSGLVLVGFDQTPGIDTSRGRIRSFIVGNIWNNGVRYEGSNELFNNGQGPRSEIMRGVY